MRYYEQIEKVLELNGWTLVCISPLEIENENTGAFATLDAAQIVIEKFMLEYETP